MVVSLLVWMFLGAVVGAISTKFVDTRGDSPIVVVGAAAGGAVLFGLTHRFISGDIELLSVLGLILVAIGAGAGAAIYHVVRARSISRDRQTVRSSY